MTAELVLLRIAPVGPSSPLTRVRQNRTMDQIIADLGISWQSGIAVAISATCMYAVMSLVLKLWGERLRNSRSTATVAVMTLIGSIAARASLGPTPTMAGGLIALVTLLLLERIFGVLMRFGRSMVHHDAPGRSDRRHRRHQHDET